MKINIVLNNGKRNHYARHQQTFYRRSHFREPTDSFEDSTLNLKLDLFKEELRVLVDETNVNNTDQDIKLITFAIEPSHTIEQVISMITERMGSRHPSNDCDRIQRNGNNEGMLLANIIKKSRFDLSIMTRGGMLVFAEAKRPRKLNIEVQTSFSVLETKQLIKEKEFFSAGKPVLSFKDTELSDLRPLSFYKIEQNAEINLKILLPPEEEEYKMIKIFVRTLAGQDVGIQIRLVDTVRNLKEKILQSIKKSINQQKLKYRGEELKDSRTISNYGIQDQERVELFF